MISLKLAVFPDFTGGKITFTNTLQTVVCAEYMSGRSHSKYGFESSQITHIRVHSKGALRDRHLT